MTGLIFIMLLIAIFQIPFLLKEKRYRELFMFLILWLGSGIYASLVVLDFPYVSPFEFITKIVEIVLY